MMERCGKRKSNQHWEGQWGAEDNRHLFGGVKRMLLHVC